MLDDKMWTRITHESDNTYFQYGPISLTQFDQLLDLYYSIKKSNSQHKTKPRGQHTPASR